MKVVYLRAKAEADSRSTAPILYVNAGAQPGEQALDEVLGGPS